MSCRRCGRALDVDARFCASCGLPVGVPCAGCGAPLDPEARFCKHCGHAADASASAILERLPGDPFVALRAAGAPGSPARERKVATLLFADIVGFTSLGEGHDPELVATLVATTFERLSQEVARYEGTIEKFAGDALLAVFGVPSVHEDDPERAVRAALEMQAAMISVGASAGGRPALALRIGIETGEVLVDLTRARDERDLFVTGDAVNTAARLQAAAEPGAIVVGPSTYAASRDIVEYRELPVLELRGKAVPVAAWQAVSVKARRGDRRAPLGIGGPLVGRDHEMTLLKDTVRRAVEDGRPHLVTVIGSAGVGKSRLAWELEKYLDGLPRVHRWRKGRCLAYSSRSFGAIADIVKADARVHDDDAPATTRQKLRQRIAELAIPAADVPALQGALEAVLAVGEPRDHPREELFEAWRRYFSALAAADPLVVVIEDIHWADDGSLAFIEFLARWAEGPLLVLCLARHELLESRPSWGGGLTNALTVFLEPLAAAATERLMDGLLEGGVPAPLRDRIVTLSEGNPLFAEEMVRMLVDRGALRFADGHWELAHDVGSIDIPPSVQAVLAARLDTLPAEEKRVAQDAAVVGRIFWDVVVAHLAQAGREPTHELIRRLRVKDLVVQRRPSSLAEAAEYGFRHVLIRDVAYDSLPKRDRSRLHRDIAGWAESELADRIEEFAELIAGHLSAALAYEEEFALDDDEDLRLLRGLTKRAALRAARRAAAISQLAAAGRWLKLAVDLARKLQVPAREMADLAREYADVAWENADARERDAVLAAAIDGLQALPDRTAADTQLLAGLRGQRGQALYEAGEADAARDLLLPASPTSSRARPAPPAPRCSIGSAGPAGVPAAWRRRCPSWSAPWPRRAPAPAGRPCAGRRTTWAPPWPSWSARTKPWPCSRSPSAWPGRRTTAASCCAATSTCRPCATGAATRWRRSSTCSTRACGWRAGRRPPTAWPGWPATGRSSHASWAVSTKPWPTPTRPSTTRRSSARRTGRHGCSREPSSIATAARRRMRRSTSRRPSASAATTSRRSPRCTR